jgi:8-oxo-dGTP pyrophosphatase MutT (NUDIX family)
MTRKQRTERLYSVGGLVHRLNGGAVEVVLCGRRSPALWGLPKGTPEPGETSEDTARREVMEETGLRAAVSGFIDSIEYWFVRPTDGVRCYKSVAFYLMSPIGGDISLHDREFDMVQWFPAEEALRTLTYANETKIVGKGLSMVAKRAAVG